MTATIAILAICVGLGLACHFGACIAYGPCIQRYVESLGESPTFFGFIWSLHRDYLRARYLAKRWGHRLDFLSRFEVVEVVARALLICALLIWIVSGVAR